MFERRKRSVIMHYDLVERLGVFLTIRMKAVYLFTFILSARICYGQAHKPISHQQRHERILPLSVI
jgi:hypothetical protein